MYWKETDEKGRATGKAVFAGLGGTALGDIAHIPRINLKKEQSIENEQHYQQQKQGAMLSNSLLRNLLKLLPLEYSKKEKQNPRIKRKRKRRQRRF